MFDGRDFTELSMYPKTDWTDEELAYYHRSFQQILPYLNAEGVTIQREIITEMMERENLKQYD